MLIPKYNIILSKHYCADLSNGLTTGDIFPAQRGACAQRGAGASPQQHGAHPVLHPELHTQLPNTGCSFILYRMLCMASIIYYNIQDHPQVA